MDLMKRFRAIIYSLFNKRRDAIMNLLDAISSFGHESQSVVELSEAPCFERQYTSITDAISDGLPHADWQAIECYQFSTFFNAQSTAPPCFVLDCTSNPRPFANKLADRSIVHSPNPAPGNKPICVGHQYSCVALLSQDEMARVKKWITPLSIRRVHSDAKGNEIGMAQLRDHIKEFKLGDKLVISVGDSLYGSEACRIIASNQPNLVHIFRLNTKRNVFLQPVPDEKIRRGRKKEYGDKMMLSMPKTHPEADESVHTLHVARSGRIYHVKIDAWYNLLLRGSRHYRASHDPMTVIRIQMLNEQGELVFTRPLWLSILGQRRDEIQLVDVYQTYHHRYDIEHFFRFGKNKLLLDSYQTSDVIHEENWWRLCMLAYNQLFLGKSLVTKLIKPWEKYLPEHNEENPSRLSVATPSQTQRGFAALLQTIGTPAVPCIRRGESAGRKKNQAGLTRADEPVIFKSKMPEKNTPKIINRGLENEVVISNPKRIQGLVRYVRISLANLGLTHVEFMQILCDTG